MRPKYKGGLCPLTHLRDLLLILAPDAREVHRGVLTQRAGARCFVQIQDLHHVVKFFEVMTVGIGRDQKTLGISGLEEAIADGFEGDIEIITFEEKVNVTLRGGDTQLDFHGLGE